MRNISRVSGNRWVLLLLLPLLFFVSGCTNNTGTSSTHAQQTKNVPASADCYQHFGVTLSGAEWEGQDYIRPTVDELKYYSAKGVRFIRLEIRWDRVQPNLYGPLNMDEVNWIKTFVGEANKLNVSVDVDLHQRSELDDLNFGDDLPVESLANFWRNLAGQLRDVPGICGYGIANEPDHTPDFYDLWQDQANAVINAIWSVDRQHFIFVCEDRWTFSARWRADQAEQIIDPSDRLVFEAHSYWDRDQSGRYDPDTPPKDADEAKMLVEKNLAPFVNWCNAKHRRCFVGEFGVPYTGPKDNTWLLALDDALSYMKQNNIAGAYWAGGPGWDTDYPLSIEQHADYTDSQQMKVLEKYLAA